MPDDLILRLIRREAKRRPPGRPRVVESPADRARHIQCAFHRLVYHLSLTECQRIHQVGRATVVRWSRLALTYDDPEAEGLRRLVNS